MSRIIVTTVPFAAHDKTPLEMAAAAGVDLVINPKGRKLKASELREVIGGYPVVIAGTENYTPEVIASCPDLRAICRVGIGLDSVDLIAARKRDIAVSYTPDGPSAAVAELTIGLMIDLLRGIGQADRGMRSGEWQRVTGRRISTSTVGVIGVGRIGRRVIRHLQGGFAGVRILAHDPSPDPTLDAVTWVDKETLYMDADVITLHIPLAANTLNLISERELGMMKPSAVLINTSRGGIVNEADLASALSAGTINSAAIDVFMQEPYVGGLAKLPNALLTCHMGSMTTDCRARMEIEATADAIQFLKSGSFRSPVPEVEYLNARKVASN